MKIKIGNIFKFNSKQEKEDVIKFEDAKKKRKGSEVEKSKDSKIGIKILSAMVLLLVLTITLTNGAGKKVEDANVIQPKGLTTVATSSSIDNKTEDKVLASIKKEDKLIFSKPIEGEIQKMYSIDKVIYSKTLAQWKTHDGLDIKPTSGLDVKALEKGVVEDIYDDSFLGKTIVIEHIAGYTSQYSNLDNQVYVNVGESVVKGQKIGKVGNTSIGEALDEPHLHLMIFQNGKSLNPTYIYD